MVEVSVVKGSRLKGEATVEFNFGKISDAEASYIDGNMGRDFESLRRVDNYKNRQGEYVTIAVLDSYNSSRPGKDHVPHEVLMEAEHGAPVAVISEKLAVLTGKIDNTVYVDRERDIVTVDLEGVRLNVSGIAEKMEELYGIPAKNDDYLVMTYDEGYKGRLSDGGDTPFLVLADYISSSRQLLLSQETFETMAGFSVPADNRAVTENPALTVPEELSTLAQDARRFGEMIERDFGGDIEAYQKMTPALNNFAMFLALEEGPQVPLLNGGEVPQQSFSTVAHALRQLHGSEAEYQETLEYVRAIVDGNEPETLFQRDSTTRHLWLQSKMLSKFSPESPKYQAIHDTLDTMLQRDDSGNIAIQDPRDPARGFITDLNILEEINPNAGVVVKMMNRPDYTAGYDSRTGEVRYAENPEEIKEFFPKNAKGEPSMIDQQRLRLGPQANLAMRALEKEIKNRLDFEGMSVVRQVAGEENGSALAHYAQRIVDKLEKTLAVLQPNGPEAEGVNVTMTDMPQRSSVTQDGLSTGMDTSSLTMEKPDGKIDLVRHGSIEVHSQGRGTMLERK